MNMQIFVSQGQFSDIREAAFSENMVDWWDASDNNAVHCTECYAAVSLLTHLEILNNKTKSFDEISLFNASNYNSQNFDCNDPVGIRILIGNKKTNPVIALLESELGESVSSNEKVLAEGFRIKSLYYETSLYIILSGNDRTGTLYSVYAFLEKTGIEKFGPGEKGIHYPDTFNIDNDLTNMDFIENLAYKTRGCYSEYIDDSCDELLDWASFNRMNYVHFLKISNPHKIKKLGMNISGGGHNVLYRFMDPNQEYPYNHKLTYSEAHPEWYIMTNGKRSFSRNYEQAKNGYFTGDNFCTSNDDAVNELTKLITNDLSDGELSKVDYFDFWMLDNGKWCQCDKCVDPRSGNLSYKLIMLVYNLDKKIKEAQEQGRIKRPIKILFPAYHETLPSPDKPLPEDFDFDHCIVTYFPIERCFAHNINDENCTETNKFLLDTYLPWAKGCNRNYKGDVFIGEYYNVSSFAAMPFIFSERIANDIPYYYNSGTKHFYYMHMTSGNWGMLTLNNWLHAKLLWNPDECSDRLKEKYFALYYGNVCKEMKKFYDLLEKATANCKYLKHYQIVNGRIMSLHSKISNALLTNNENASGYFFQLEHMQYEENTLSSDKLASNTSENSNSNNRGISLTETINMIHECRMLLNQIMVKAGGQGQVEDRILEDNMRFTYGEYMLQFIYYMLQTAIFKNSKQTKLMKASFDKAKIYAEILKKMSEPIANYTYGKEFKNGLSASWLEKAYVNFEIDKTIFDVK